MALYLSPDSIIYTASRFESARASQERGRRVRAPAEAVGWRVARLRLPLVRHRAASVELPRRGRGLNYNTATGSIATSGSWGYGSS
eukprot:995871-Prymnesium_polylepis.2